MTLSTWGVFERRKKKRLRRGFHFGQDCLELHLSALANKMKWQATSIAKRWKINQIKKSMCVLFNVKLDTVQKDYIMSAW